jgi:hypothetical protein
MGLLDYFTMSPATQNRMGGLLTQLQDWQAPDNPMRQAREGQRRRAMEDEELAWQRTQRGRQQSQWDTQSKDEALIKRLMGQRTMMGPTSATEMGPPEGVPTGGMVDPGMFVNQGGSVGGLNAVQGVNALLKPPKQDLINVGPGGALVDPRTGKAVFNAPFKPSEESRPEVLRLMEARDGLPDGHPNKAALSAIIKKMEQHAPAASIVNYGSPVPVQLPDGTTGYVQPSNRGGPAAPMLTPDGKPLVKPAGTEKDPAGEERKAATLLQRLRGSQAQLTTALQGSASAAKPSVLTEATRRVAGDTAANLVTPQARQRVEAAQLDMLDAALTLATGAAYTKEQLEGHRRSYFPQIGDDAATVADKQARLQNVISAAEIAAGRAASKVPKFAEPASAASTPGAVRRFNPATGKIE